MVAPIGSTPRGSTPFTICSTSVLLKRSYSKVLNREGGFSFSTRSSHSPPAALDGPHKDWTDGFPVATQTPNKTKEREGGWENKQNATHHGVLARSLAPARACSLACAITLLRAETRKRGRNVRMQSEKSATSARLVPFFPS